jgi:acetyl esterase/lipase
MAKQGSAASFKALFEDIGQDYGWPLHHPETATDGGKIYRNVPYATIDGYRPLMLEAAVPSGAGPHPVIVYIHGGAWRIGSPHITNPVYRRMDFLERFYRAGFAVVRVAYRFTKEVPFPAQLHDCKSAIRYLRRYAGTFNIDPQRMGVIGDSAGGHLAALVGLTGKVKALEGKVGVTQGSSAVQCAVNWFGPSNFLTMQKHKTKLRSLGDTHHPDSPESWLLGGPVPKRKAQARAASPVTYASRKVPPMLLQYGDKDRLVPFEQGEELYEALKAKGADVTLQRVPGADHCFWGTEHDFVIEDDIAFFKKHLGR